MNAQITILTACAAMAIATPALASPTYVGKFKGIVTSGGYQLAGLDDIIYSEDLTGQPVDVTFTASFFDFLDDAGNPSPAVDVKVSAKTPGYQVSFEAVSASYDYSVIQSATFSGNGKDCAVTADWYDVFYGETYHFDMTYGGTGAIPGSVAGSGQAYYTDFYDYPQTSLGFSFHQISGSVSVLGAVEPSTWALMIGGFGMVGAALRRRHANVRISYA
jgi:hypothetical protein